MRLIINRVVCDTTSKPPGTISGNRMICIKTDIPQEICDIDDELKAIYHREHSMYLDI